MENRRKYFKSLYFRERKQKKYQVATEACMIKILPWPVKYLKYKEDFQVHGGKWSNVTKTNSIKKGKKEDKEKASYA